ncbi:MAG: hypothetical protein KTR24_09125, partial [Saprospiraceae bacterium]|nr:hypothetical protein [Saprospiraceae bacterium]
MSRFILLLGVLFLAASCDKDDPIPDVNFEDDAIFYDKGPNDAPQLPRNLSYTAVRFAADDLERSGHVGRDIRGVDFWIQDVPDAIKVIIHEWGNRASQPGAVLYESTLTSGDLSSRSWINHDLSENVRVPSEGFWVILEINTGDRDLRVTGCDVGPRHPNGDV